MINLTQHELNEELLKIDELTLLEILKITPEDVIERFQDRIEENFDTLLEEVDALKEIDNEW